MLQIQLYQLEKQHLQFYSHPLQTNPPKKTHAINLAKMTITKIENDIIHNPLLKLARTLIMKMLVMLVVLRFLEHERKFRSSIGKMVKVLRNINKVGIQDSCIRLSLI